MSRRRDQRGQALTELALVSVLLILILLGIVDFARLFQFNTALQEAAREGARHAAWYDGTSSANPFLDDGDIQSVVNNVLKGAGINNAVVQQAPGTCNGSGPQYGPPFSYPASTAMNQPWLYVCYNTDNGSPTTQASGPNPCSGGTCGGYDIEVVVLMRFGLVVQSGQFGPSIPIQGYAHIRVQGS